MRLNKASQMYESNIHSLKAKIEEIEKSFQTLEGGIKEKPKTFSNMENINRFTQDHSPMGSNYLHESQYLCLIIENTK